MERGRVGEVVREIMKSHSAQGFVDKLKDFGFHSGRNGKLLRNLSKRKTWIWTDTYFKRIPLIAVRIDHPEQWWKQKGQLED